MVMESEHMVDGDGVDDDDGEDASKSPSPAWRARPI
jgi:hypothetical protein